MKETTKVTEFEVLDHGIDHAQYFQGCGVCFTRFENVSTGCGNNFQEAIDDALEQIACQFSGIDFPEFEQSIKDKLGIKTVAWPDTVCVPEDSEGLFYYVSIRFNVEPKV